MPVVFSISLFAVLFVRLCLAGSRGKGSGWDYSSMPNEDWKGICYTGRAQSPIDFVEPTYKDIENFMFFNYEKDPWKITVTNNGFTYKFTVQTKPDEVPYIKGGGLNGTYVFAQAHFHWGGRSNKGSEHTVMGKAYPAELHFVHYKKDYGSLALAAAKPDGLAVLGVFFQLVQEPHPFYGKLLYGTSKVKTLDQLNSNEPLDDVFPLKILLPDNREHFFRYQGSLTTPPCAESVTWTVFTKAVQISEDQLYLLRTLRDKDDYPLVNNFRPPKPVNGRDYFVTDANFSSSDILPAPVEPSYRYDVDKGEPEEVDHFFLLIMSIIIFFMQCGFAFMEAGAVRSKNTVNILIKNWLDMCIGALVYWAVGFALTFGDSPPAISKFVGTSFFFFHNMPAYKLSKWFFQFVFAATAATLVSGSLAERCNFIAYIVYSVMITGFIYPIIAHWTWHREGWLRILGYHDFAGSGVVHLTGAVCALVGCVMMGPRVGRFDKDGKPVPMPGHSTPLSALGGLILVFGFFACNGTKQGSISKEGDGIAIALAIVNTALGTSAAGLSTLIFNKTGIVPGSGGKYSFLLTMNGSLTGTVALCAGCNVFEAWGAVLVGAICGPLFLYFNYLLLQLKIDDPLDAIPVHGVGGFWGTFSVYLFKKKTGIFYTWNRQAFIGLGWNVVGLICIILWTGIMCFIMFYLLKKLKMLRVEAEFEFKGMDIIKHGESAYPADAWVEAQYMKEGAIMDDDEDDNDDDDKDNAGGTAESGENGEANIANHPKSPSVKSKSRDGLPPNMKFSRAASYNNPHEMFPSASKLFSGMNTVAGNVAIDKKRKKSKMTSVAEEGTADEIERLHKDEIRCLYRADDHVEQKE